VADDHAANVAARMTTHEQQPTAVRKRLLDQVREYVMTQRGIELDHIDEETRFREDLDLDSLDVAALALDWEDEYGMTVEDERVVTCTTVGKAIDLVEELARTA
jgi:acyl carrier protein